MEHEMEHDNTLATDATERPLFARLHALGIETETHRHPPLHTVAESKALRRDLPGAHIKNLFLRDKKRNMWLVTVLEDHRINLKRLRQLLETSGNLSFGSADLLRQTLGVEPGAVTPFAVMNDAAGLDRAVIDRALTTASVVNAHPLHNQATTAIAATDLLAFMSACGHSPLVLDL